MTSQNKPLARLLATLALSSASLAACCGLGAQPNEGAPRKPPPEALQACKGLKAAQDCAFTSLQGPVKGSCWAPPDKPLACRPKDAPPPPPAKP